MPTSTLAPNEPPNRVRRFGFFAVAGSCVAVILAALVLVWSGVTTASARFSGTTSNESSLFSAAAVDVIVGTPGLDRTQLRIDADRLYPGRIVERCIPVRYSGSIDGVAVRLVGQNRGGTGLESFVRSEIEVGSGRDNECADFRSERSAFQGSLAELWQGHSDFGTGLDIMEAASDGDAVTVRIRVEVESNNKAQGLTNEFSLLIEARP